MVHGGRRAGETFGAEEFFGVKATIGATELNVSLLWEQAELGVKGHETSKVESDMREQV